MKKIIVVLYGLFLIQAACQPKEVTNKAKYNVKQQFYFIENEPRTNSANETFNPVNTVYFGYNRTDLTSESKNKLQSFYQNVLQQNPANNFYVEGNTDTSGTLDYNYELSRKRAESVLNYLVVLGLNPQKLHILPKGELNTIADDNISPELNRRVTIYRKNR